MYHEFIIVDKNEIPNQISYNLKLNHHSIKVSDDIIVNNDLFLKGFKTYKIYLNNIGEGLDYYGNTILPTQSIEKFVQNIKKAYLTNGDDVIQNQLSDLIEMCNQALKENKYLIHFGI